MVITSGLAGYALVQRNSAQRQTVRAEAEAETARRPRISWSICSRSPIRARRAATASPRARCSTRARHASIRGLASQPAIQATLKDTLGTVYMGLGLYRQARPLLDGALATRQQLKGTEPIVLTDSFSHRGWLLMSQADYKGAEQDYRQVLRLLASEPDEPAHARGSRQGAVRPRAWCSATRADTQKHGQV